MGEISSEPFKLQLLLPSFRNLIPLPPSLSRFPDSKTPALNMLRGELFQYLLLTPKTTTTVRPPQVTSSTVASGTRLLGQVAPLFQGSHAGSGHGQTSRVPNAIPEMSWPLPVVISERFLETIKMLREGQERQPHCSTGEFCPFLAHTASPGGVQLEKEARSGWETRKGAHPLKEP